MEGEGLEIARLKRELTKKSAEITRLKKEALDRDMDNEALALEVILLLASNAKRSFTDSPKTKCEVEMAQLFENIEKWEFHILRGLKRGKETREKLNKGNQSKAQASKEYWGKWLAVFRKNLADNSELKESAARYYVGTLIEEENKRVGKKSGTGSFKVSTSTLNRRLKVPKSSS